MSEHNLFQEIDADLERQRLEDLWRRYGGWILLTAVAIIIATGAWTFWHSWHERRDQAATARLVELENLKDADAKQQIAALTGFAGKNPHDVQGRLAALNAAALADAQGDKAQALALYNQVAQDQGFDSALRQFADLQAVRVQMDSADPAGLIKRLESLTAEQAPWQFTAMEYEGYLALKAGDKAKARAVFTDLSQHAGVPSDLAQRASDMLHYVSE